MLLVLPICRLRGSETIPRNLQNRLPETSPFRRFQPGTVSAPARGTSRQRVGAQPPPAKGGGSACARTRCHSAHIRQNCLRGSTPCPRAPATATAAPRALLSGSSAAFLTDSFRLWAQRASAERATSLLSCRCLRASGRASGTCSKWLQLLCAYAYAHTHAHAHARELLPSLRLLPRQPVVA